MTASPPPRVDTHAHIFTRACALAADRRYTPAGEAPLSAYLDLLAAHGVTHGVLVQPSILGTDNSYLLESLRTAGGKLRGIAVVDPSFGRARLEEMEAAGVVGIRINLVGKKEMPDFEAPEWRGLLGRVAALGWQVEANAEAGLLPGLLAALNRAGVNIVVDHFGRPDTRLGLECPVFRALLREAETSGRIWVKMSAPYRVPGGRVGPIAAALRERLGPERLVWGSDWPWNRNESGKTYQLCLDWLAEWVKDPAPREAILGATPLRLFGFSSPG